MIKKTVINSPAMLNPKYPLAANSGPDPKLDNPAMKAIILSVKPCNFPLFAWGRELDKSEDPATYPKLHPSPNKNKAIPNTIPELVKGARIADDAKTSAPTNSIGICPNLSIKYPVTAANPNIPKTWAEIT